MKFLSKDQQKELTDLDWDLVPNRKGCAWVASYFDEKDKTLDTLSKLLPLDNTVSGYSFLVVAYKQIKEQV